MEAVLLALAAAASAGGLWWYQSRPRLRELTSGSYWDEDAEVILHVAQHEATTRTQALSSIHILFGLLQDQAIVDVLREAGHDVEAFEGRVLEALGKQTPMASGITERAQYMFVFALGSAHRNHRKATRTDLWAYLRDSDAAQLIGEAGVVHVDILFRLVHGTPPSLDSITTDVHVVLRNDDYTIQEFVTAVLTSTFGLTQEAAEALTLEVHHGGRGIIKRLPAAEARSQIGAARELARSRGFPLWIGAEPT